MAVIENNFAAKELNGNGLKMIYFIGPYGGKPLYFGRFFKKMTHYGYRIVYIQPKKSTLDATSPSNLHNTIQGILRYVQADILQKPSKERAIVGISLGSYIAVSLLGLLPIHTFVAVAGGAAILDVFRDDKLFKNAREKVYATDGGEGLLHEYWWQYDTSFKSRDLSEVRALVVNSNGDKMITPDKRERFLNDLRAAGANVCEESQGKIPHTAQALKINVLTSRINKFIQAG